MTVITDSRYRDIIFKGHPLIGNFFANKAMLAMDLLLKHASQHVCNEYLFTIKCVSLYLLHFDEEPREFLILVRENFKKYIKNTYTFV